MAIIINAKPSPDLHIQLTEKNGEIRLTYNNHDFVVCKTVDGVDVVQIVDVDTGVRHQADIKATCWRR